MPILSAGPVERAFFQAILAAQDDDTPRLVYADWLDDQAGGGHPRADMLAARAEFIRLQCWIGQRYYARIEYPDRCGARWRADLRAKKEADLWAMGDRVRAIWGEWEEEFVSGLPGEKKFTGCSGRYHQCPRFKVRQAGHWWVEHAFVRGFPQPIGGVSRTSFYPGEEG